MNNNSSFHRHNEAKSLVGSDVFVDFVGTVQEIQQKIQSLAGPDFKLQQNWQSWSLRMARPYP